MGVEYDAVLFDSDGVLVEPTTDEIMAGAIESAFAEHGIDDPSVEHVAALRSIMPDGIERICAEYGIDPDPFWRARDQAASRVQREAIADGRKPAYDDLDAVTGLRCPVGIVSNNQHPTIEAVVETFGLADSVGTYYGREPTIRGVRRKKPDPHYVNRALDDLGVDRALFVGDSNADLLAADRAGLDAAFIDRPHRAGYELAREPEHVVSDLHELAALVD